MDKKLQEGLKHFFNYGYFNGSRTVTEAGNINFELPFIEINTADNYNSHSWIPVFMLDEVSALDNQKELIHKNSKLVYKCRWSGQFYSNNTLVSCFKRSFSHDYGAETKVTGMNIKTKAGDPERYYSLPGCIFDSHFIPKLVTAKEFRILENGSMDLSYHRNVIFIDSSVLTEESALSSFIRNQILKLDLNAIKGGSSSKPAKIVLTHLTDIFKIVSLGTKRLSLSANFPTNTELLDILK